MISLNKSNVGTQQAYQDSLKLKILTTQNYDSSQINKVSTQMYHDT